MFRLLNALTAPLLRTGMARFFLAGRWGSEVKNTLFLAIPIILTNLTHAALQATSTAFISRYNPADLAASALAGSTMWLVMVVPFGLSMVSAPMMANAIGRRTHSIRDVRRTFRQTVWACWLYSAFGAVLLWNGESILLSMGQDPQLAATAGSYLRVVEWGMFPMEVFWVLRFFAATLERPRVTLVVMSMGILFNAVGNYLLIFGKWGLPELGLTGAGIASNLSSLFMCVALAVYCMMERRLKRYAVLGNWWRADWPRFVEVCRLGFPIGVTTAMEAVLFAGGALMTGLLGTVSLAAHAIVGQICGIAFMPTMGFSETATIRVGLWAGRNDQEGIRIAATVAFWLGIGWAIIPVTVMFSFPDVILSPFLDATAPDTAQIQEVALKCLALGGLFQIVDAVQFIGAGALRGLKDTKMHMIFILIGHLTLAAPIGLLLAFPGGFGVTGIWIGFVVGISCVAVMISCRWFFRDRLQLLERCQDLNRASLSGTRVRTH